MNCIALRADYPNLVTKIFEVTPRNFVIVFDKALQDASVIDFEEVRPITLQARISNELPQHYLREIEPIPDRQLARHYEGFPFKLFQLFNLVVARFPDLPIADIRDGGTPMTVTVELTTAISGDQERELMEFCTALGAPAPFRIIVTGRTLKEAQKVQEAKIITPIGPQSDALFIGASRLRAAVPAHLRADEEFWFTKLDAICAGRIAVKDMPGIFGGEARCFIDAMIGEHINFRQLLALYDTIYFSPPLLEGHQAFLEKQALVEGDLLDLIACDRLKILLTQAEERLNIPFLSAAAERSPTAIIGRRTAAAMLIADVVHTADRYRLNDRNHYAEIGQLSRAIAEKSGLPVNKVLQFILWPVEARRSAIGALLGRGTKGVLPIGMGPYFAMLIKKISGKDLDLEALMVSEKVHIAHAIGATCFPMREDPPGLHGLANIMGDAFNFFRSFNTEIAASWVGNVERKQQGKVLLPPLPILEFDAEVPIGEVLPATDRPVMRNRGRALFSRLADMTEEQREEEIRALNAQLRRFGKPSGIMSLDTLDTAVSAVATAIGAPYPPLAGLAHVGAQFFEIGKRHPAVDRFLEAVRIDLFPAGARRRELDFLSRISRAASLKTRKVS
ncbi:MAG: hypothetical protein JO166_13930 [Deltaproteobacteria bacterium]|nr:hypothetical protein [Deltaproteobacteria bacterium]